MAKRNLIVGNWKMNPLTQKEAEKLHLGISAAAKKARKTDVVACPPYVYLGKFKKASKKIMLGAQNSSWAETGAFTGEVSPNMLAQLGVKYVIIGHSERRAMGESNDVISKKLKAAISAGLLPILCIGETERDAEHEYLNVVRTQVKECLKGIPKNLIAKVIIAYEPVWAISTTANRRDATAADSYEMAIFIRKILSDVAGRDVVRKMRILYGGSVNERDAGEFFKNGGVSGLLVGRASLDAKKFSAIISSSEHS